MASDSFFLATRNTSIPAACRTIALTGDAKVSANDVRSHLLRPCELVVRVFNDADAAELWAAAMVIRGAAAAPASLSPRTSTTAAAPLAPLLLPSFPAIEGTLLTVYTDGDASVIDLADPASAAAFFMSLDGPVRGNEVVVRSLSLPLRPVTPDETSVPPPHSSGGVRHPRRQHPPHSPPPTTATFLCRHRPSCPRSVDPFANLQQTNLMLLVADAASPVSAWLGRTAGAAEVALATEVRPTALRVPVAAMPPAVQLPSRVDAETLRLCWMLLRSQDVFFTGPPGCGKTYVVNEVVEGLWDAGVAVSACGSSGVAAALVGGTKVHSWAGFCNGDADVWSPLDTVVNDVIPYAAKVRMCSSVVLIMDEVGMLSTAFMTRLHLVLRAVRRRSVPFGGLTLLATSDFLQLAPLFRSYAFLADVWSSVFGNRAVILKTNWRQIRGAQMLGLLLRLRTRQHKDGDMALLATRRTAVPPPNVVCLFCHKLDVTDKNEEELRLLPGPSVVLEAVDKVQDAPYLTLARASALLDGALKLPRVVSLRVGAVVAVPTACPASQGVPFGTRGIVFCFRVVERRRYSRVWFALRAGTSKVIDVTPTVGHVVALDGVKRAATRMQVPLVLAWASTIHSTQGWTLEEAAVNLTKAFAAGQALSGLSRTSTPGGLYLMGFYENRIIFDDASLAFHASLVSVL